ncbi:hypothetical protein LCGC14_1095030 [marine sediment metagenome]|uniref:Cyanophage baseplate Pam3 plug gp18 domain-containing protein n=1 Tax=marine sediment metagenome TaxID=412755 RepID=A0A0F9MB73_9ZZZZ
MATKVIRIAEGLGNFRFQVELESVVFTFVFEFNEREDAWYFDLLQANGTSIRRSFKVTTGFPWLRQVASRPRPNGDLIALDSTQQGLEADFDTLGNLVQFLYEESTTVAT